MELIATRTENVDGGRIRLCGTVTYDDRPLEPEEYWFEYPGEYADAISGSGNPWLVCLTPLAAALGQPLRLALPVDRLLARNMREIVAIWRTWYRTLAPVPVDAPAAEPGRREGERTALFFSAGVDSFFSLLYNDRADPESLPADDLIAVHGFDMRLDDREAFARHLGRLEAVASRTGRTLIPVRTNLRRTRLREAPWGGLWHGCALASVGLALEGRYRNLMIASTNHYAALEEWGSHPLTDHLLSSRHTRVLHDGAGFRRWEKLEFLARFDIVLDNLHVCYRNGSDDNCGDCEKCLRNMIILEVLGVLDRCATFPGQRLDLDRVARILQNRSWQPDFYRRLRAFAVSRRRDDIAKAIDRSFRRSDLLRPALRLAERLNRRRFGAVGRPLKRWVTAGTVH